MKKTTSTGKLNFKTEWDFRDLYKSITDSKLERDIEVAEKAYASFAKKYTEKSEYMEDATALKSALKDWEALSKITATSKPLWYLSLMSDIDSMNTKLRNKINLLEARITKAANSILFFPIKLGKITKDKQTEFLKDPSLKEYNYYLERIFLNAKYDLSEGEEKALSLLSLPSMSMWVDSQQKYLTSQSVKFKGKMMPLTEALAVLPTLPLNPRRILQKEVVKKLKEISFFAEAELTAVITNKKIRDELRGYNKPYESTVFGYENSLETVEALVKSVTNAFPISKNFYKLKTKLMKLPYITAADYSVDIGKISSTIEVQKGVELVRNSLERTHPVFAQIFNSMLSNGRIDMFPKKGKRTGAYCAGGVDVPTSILMNYIPSIDAVTTLAHEMGHAIHTEMSKTQPILYEGYTISVAEVASTFFENIVFDELVKTLPEKEQFWLRFNRIQDAMGTVFRQIAFFNYELDIHTQVREKGGMSAEEYASTYIKHLSSYLGSSVRFVEEDGYAFVYVPHFRYFFYVYSYAYGKLISTALYAEYKKNPAFIEKVIQFLSAGGSKSPDNIFKSIGIDTTNPAFFEEGLSSIEQDIKELEKLAKKNKLI